MGSWLELVADTRCNLRCLGCHDVDDHGAAMTTREAIDVLREGRRSGYVAVNLGGGEPTLRKDLFALAAAAREAGYQRVRLQTNGMLVGYPEYARRCFEAGVTELGLSIRGVDAETHDRLSQLPGAFELMRRGMDHWRRLGRPMDADVLVYRSNLTQLAPIVQTFQPAGIERFTFRVLSVDAPGSPALEAEVPRLTDVVREVQRAMDLRLVDSYSFIRSPHTPPCLVPRSHAHAIVLPRPGEHLVARPGGRRLPMLAHPSEGGHYTERCAACAMRGRCNGVRAGYVRIHGDAEFQPLAELRLPGTEAPLKLLDRPDEAGRRS
jgi:MoaA/NifB/PqqE/SkfB family radical SAM enzyme